MRRSWHALCPMPARSLSSPAPQLRVAPNRRFLVTSEGRPFFWLADTAWELLHRLDDEETAHYLTKRAAQGFNVVQTVALAESDGLRVPDAAGNLPFHDLDPDRPLDAYWDRLGRAVALANRLGLVVALLPTWGDKWNLKHGSGPEIFNVENARRYGAWLGRRLRAASIVWILGGDRPVETDAHRAILRAMADGLREGDGGAHLAAFHPCGAAGSSRWFPDEPWLDFHIRQNGHAVDYTGRYDETRADYDLCPPRPVIDAEPVYEDIGIDFAAPRHGHAVAADVRRACYWNLFNGACGHTYGHNAVWQMWAPGRAPVLDPLLPWREALDAPGAAQMIHARRLFESRPILERVPDDALLVPHPLAPHLFPGAGRARFAATRDIDGTYAFVYAPVGRAFTVDTSRLSGKHLRASWFNPRDGSVSPAGEIANTGRAAFTPPTPGEALDWILVLDDAARAYPAPGTVR